MTCSSCKYHDGLYHLVDGEYHPTNLFRCRGPRQKATYTNRVLSVWHPMAMKCKCHSDYEVDDNQIKIEVGI